MEPILLRADRAGERADQLLARLVPELTRSAAQRLLEAGAVTLGGRPVKKNDKAAAGDVLEVRLPEPEPVDVLPQDIPLDVAYEDADVIVVNKPVGLVVHPAAGHPDGTLVNALLYHCGESLSGINGALRPGIVHRIDRDTSCLLYTSATRAAPTESARRQAGRPAGAGRQNTGSGHERNRTPQCCGVLSVPSAGLLTHHGGAAVAQLVVVAVGADVLAVVPAAGALGGLVQGDGDGAGDEAVLALLPLHGPGGDGDLGDDAQGGQIHPGQEGGVGLGHGCLLYTSSPDTGQGQSRHSCRCR